jgi:hypothetical protein
MMAKPKTKPTFWTTDTNGRLQVNLHAGQAPVWRSRKRFVFMIAGTQSGKTSFGPLWLWREIQAKGAGDYLAVTSTFPLLNRKMLPEFRRLFEHTLHLGTWHASDRVFEYHDGETRVMFGSASNSDSLESATAKAAWLDEVGQDNFRLESWEAILRRLSLYEGRVLGTTTPYNLGWLKQRVHDVWRAGDRDYDVIQFDSSVNPVFPRREYQRARRSLPAWKFQLFYQGRFSRPAGMIYGDFIDAYREQGGHKVHPFTIPPEWPRYVGIDYGAVNTALVWLARDPAINAYYLYRESLEGGKTSAEHVRSARALAQGENVISWHGGSKSEKQQRWDWGEGSDGISVQEPPVSDVEAGIDRVIALFKTWRLFVFDTCAGVLDELGRYSRVLDELNQPTEKIANKETFHRLDALRYAAIGMTDPPGAGVSTDPEPAPWQSALGRRGGLFVRR